MTKSDHRDTGNETCHQKKPHMKIATAPKKMAFKLQIHSAFLVSMMALGPPIVAARDLGRDLLPTRFISETPQIQNKERFQQGSPS